MSCVPSVYAQTTGAGPYYATPSWDQKILCDTPSACPRFIVLSNWNNQAVLDRETGLVWEQAPDAARTDFTGARFVCDRKKVGNRLGWRVPTVQDLASLLDPADPAIASRGLPVGHPFGNVEQSAAYWTATTLTGNTTFGFVVEVGIGNVDLFTKGTLLPVWCVRGGPGVVDSQ
jgi:hypothetical protein